MEQKENLSIGSSNKCNSDKEEIMMGKLKVDQVAILEQLFVQCENPTDSHILAMISANSVLSNLDCEKIQVWFKCRRLLEKKEKLEILKFQVMTERLMIEHQYLKDTVQHLLKEKEYIEKLNQHVSVRSLVAAEAPRSVFKNTKAAANRNLLLLENDFLMSELVQLEKEGEYMRKTNTNIAGLGRNRDGLDELIDIVRVLRG